MESYIRDLTNNLLSVYEDSGDKVEVEIKAQDIAVNIDTAIPCGLIINELFSNCLKHAFHSTGSDENGRANNLITVLFEKSEDGRLTLMVEDNGVGFPGDLDFRNTESLGLQLVCTLTDQIKGQVDVYSCDGTCFKLTFSVLEN